MKKSTALTAFILALLLSVLSTPVSADTTSPSAPSVSAKSAVLINATDGKVLWEKNSDEKMGMASTTKIMTAILAIESGDMNRSVKVSEQAAGIEGSSIYLTAGEELTMEQLVCALMLESANDAAAAIACEVSGSIGAFAALMNEKARQLSLDSTHFTNPHGLYDEEHYTTAYDLARLAAYAMTNSDFARIVSTVKTTIPLKGTEGTRLLVNHNRLLRTYDGMIGVKTGFTKKTGRCLVSAAERDGVRLIAVTLCAPDDWNDHRSLLDYGFERLESRCLIPEGGLTFSLPCAGSETGYALFTAEKPLNISCDKGTGSVSTVLEYDRPLYAPLGAGEQIGWVVFKADGSEVARAPLICRSGCHQIKKVKKGLFGMIPGPK